MKKTYVVGWRSRWGASGVSKPMSRAEAGKECMRLLSSVDIEQTEIQEITPNPPRKGGGRKGRK